MSSEYPSSSEHPTGAILHAQPAIRLYLSVRPSAQHNGFLIVLRGEKAELERRRPAVDRKYQIASRGCHDFHFQLRIAGGSMPFAWA